MTYDPLHKLSATEDLANELNFRREYDPWFQVDGDLDDFIFYSAESAPVSER